MKKKTYTKPEVRTVLYSGPVVMLGGSNTVNEYQEGGIITVGDTDEITS